MVLLLLALSCQDPSSAKDSPSGALSDSAPTEGDTTEGDPLADDSATLPSNTPCTATTAPEGDYFAPGTLASVALSACSGVTLVSSGAIDQSFEVTLDSWVGDLPLVSVTDVAGHPLMDAASPPFTIQLWQSGEVFLSVVPSTDGDASGTLSLSCVSACELESTRYPIVLFHGMGGAGIFGGTDYFYEIRDLLEARGYLVRNPSVEAFATTEERAEQWAEILDGLMAEGLGRRFNIIAHSQGGLDARYLASGLGYGDHIASIDMIGTPNQGTVVADVLSGTVSDGYVSPELIDLGAGVFASLYGLDADDQSLADAMASLTTESVAALNLAAPDVPEVYYRSWAGYSCGTLEFDCQDDHGGEVVEPLLEATYLIPWAYGLPNDGLVPTFSPPWGDYQGEIFTDHLDEIGHFSDSDNAAFDHRAFYLSEVQALSDGGF